MDKLLLKINCKEQKEKWRIDLNIKSDVRVLTDYMGLLGKVDSQGNLGY